MAAAREQEGAVVIKRGTGPHNKYGLAFHHLGLAVARPDNAVLFLGGIGYRVGPAIFDPLQKVNLMMCDHATMPAVEIIFPAVDGGPLDGFLRQHKDGLVYHACYAAQDVEAAIDAMEADGLHLFCVSPPTTAVLFGGKEVSFYVVADVGLIEIIHTGEKSDCH